MTTDDHQTADSSFRINRPFSDSPWFWAYLFTAAALVALALIAPKYTARQAQIERQFEGRQRAGQPAANDSPAAPPREQFPESPLTTVENRITLKPLFLGLAALTILIWFIHWRTRPTTRSASHSTDN